MIRSFLSSRRVPAIRLPVVPPAESALVPVLTRIRAASAVVLVLLAAVAFSSPATAHDLGGPMGGFGSGFGHPLAGFDHFLAMLAVGLWGAQMGGRSVWTLPATFPLIMCVGGIAGMFGLLPDEAIRIAIAVSLMVLGGVIAAGWRAPEWAALVIVALFAIFHGYPHGQATLRAADPAAFTVGFVVSTGVIHILGIGVGYGLKGIWRGNLVRALGGVIAVCGVYFLFK
ncbi:HupE/UreJ family protein [Rhizobium cremeum]|uniref:HupE/UreJ family protein n=1 Tax=Rhizobium cremeum TaxID=2813827 RepID=UPI000DD86A27|nr:HupE/UreJ family protein [Rhizobium cremeum]MCJ7997455.1 HupE/UreJ family protein [Rhizobium cremeum]MCJ8002549.1 HupE/UreJ family protein [Rhizobium cremeum]